MGNPNMPLAPPASASLPMGGLPGKLENIPCRPFSPVFAADRQSIVLAISRLCAQQGM